VLKARQAFAAVWLYTLHGSLLSSSQSGANPPAWITNTVAMRIFLDAYEDDLQTASPRSPAPTAAIRQTDEVNQRGRRVQSSGKTINLQQGHLNMWRSWDELIDEETGCARERLEPDFWRSNTILQEHPSPQATTSRSNSASLRTTGAQARSRRERSSSNVLPRSPEPIRRQTGDSAVWSSGSTYLFGEVETPCPNPTARGAAGKQKGRHHQPTSYRSSPKIPDEVPSDIDIASASAFAHASRYRNDSTIEPDSVRPLFSGRSLSTRQQRTSSDLHSLQSDSSTRAIFAGHSTRSLLPISTSSSKTIVSPLGTKAPRVRCNAVRKVAPTDMPHVTPATSFQELLHPYVLHFPQQNQSGTKHGLLLIKLCQPMNFSRVLQHLGTLRDFVHHGSVGMSTAEVRVMTKAVVGEVKERMNLGDDMGMWFVILRDSLRRGGGVVRRSG